MENKTPYLKIHHELECSFINFFESKGYQRLAPVPISSHVDRSVYLINSATNLFKPYFSSNHCVFAIQHCMRTQTLSDYYNENLSTQQHLIHTELSFLQVCFAKYSKIPLNYSHQLVLNF